MNREAFYFVKNNLSMSICGISYAVGKCFKCIDEHQEANLIISAYKNIYFCFQCFSIGSVDEIVSYIKENKINHEIPRLNGHNLDYKEKTELELSTFLKVSNHEFNDEEIKNILEIPKLMYRLQLLEKLFDKHIYKL